MFSPYFHHGYKNRVPSELDLSLDHQKSLGNLRHTSGCVLRIGHPWNRTPFAAGKVQEGGCRFREICLMRFRYV